MNKSFQIVAATIIVVFMVMVLIWSLSSVAEAPTDLPSNVEPSTLPDVDAGDTPDESVACTMDAKQCPDGSYVGRVAPDCEFAECPATPEPADSDEVVVQCTEEMKQAEFCTEEYAPVCGLVEVQCITAPCDPVPQTFSNGCSACARGNVISYTGGACQ